jgi:glycosyltransferase involved in cell wall biosynthesis
VDRWIAVSDFCARFMGDYLRIPAGRISTVPLGINLSGYAARRGGEDDGTFRVGYFGRIAPEKGLRLLADAFQLLRRRTGGARVRLEAAGYMAASEKPYLEDVRKSLDSAGLLADFEYRGELDRAGKVSFLQTLDVFSMPATYDEPKGMSLLEAMASGVPVVQPRRGAFPEIVEKTGGGLLVDVDDAASLAEGLHTLWRDRPLAQQLGQRGFAGVRAHYSIERSSERMLEVYREMIDVAARVGQTAQEPAAILSAAAGGGSE